ncbi:MAG: hypothetical protein J7K26_01715 [Candidatus Aenigmarchaeota archaeon]|nr:hypothetical protein [Candidatus Aenigmarchaeota archaeon]
MKKIALLGIILIIMISGCIGSPVTKYEFAGKTLNFRADLREAEKINVYPDEQTLWNMLMGPYVRIIHIGFYPNDTENPYYTVAAYELSYKLQYINDVYWGPNQVEIKPMILNSTKDLMLANEVEPIILMLGPSKANETSIRIDNYLITVSGKDFSEIDRTYTDLDLAVDKLLLVLMKTKDL